MTKLTIKEILQRVSRDVLPLTYDEAEQAIADFYDAKFLWALGEMEFSTQSNMDGRDSGVRDQLRQQAITRWEDES